jgi:predicted DNA-binding ribbon-helix-helix protein
MNDTTLSTAVPAQGAMNVALARLAADTPERKRSVVLAGHRTSVSVEPLFWNELRRVAVGRDQSLNSLVTEIDRDAAATGSLSSALRVFVLDQTRGAG